MRAFALLLALLCAASAADRKPNIIFILADDLGYGELGCFGQKQIATPNLDRMAEEGIRFTRFYAGSTVCAPSRSVLMTGKHTGHTRVRGNAGKLNQDAQTLRKEDLSMAEVLKGAGYSTALIGKWGLAYEGSQGVPTKKGFDYFYGYLDQTHAHNPYPPFIMRNEERVTLRNKLVEGSGKGAAEGSGIAEEPLDFVPDLMAEEALSFVRKNKERPFFLFWSLVTPHANNEGTKHGRGQEVPDLGAYKDKDWSQPDKGHAAVISRLDADVGRMLGLIKELGLDENTLVVFSSDNGPHKEGGNSPDFFQSSGAYSGIKRSLKDGGIRVPTIARWPKTIAPGVMVSTAFWFADLLPTFAEVAHAEPGVVKGADGISFAELLRRSTFRPPIRKTFYWEFHEGGFSQAVLMDEQWKAIRLKRKDAPIELYDTTKDVGEEKDVASEHPDLVERAKKLFETEREDSADWPIKNPPATKKAE